ncbi:Ger(x)C family spore germination protein [Paenibacillus thalictri]|nr:Ger(x)C family spore germination protein [Paenibacillus thalictri]
MLFLCFLIMTALLTGCWSRRELNDLGIVLGIGIDKSGNEYEVSVQIVNPSDISLKKGGGGGRSPITVYSAKGNTVVEAIRRLTMLTPRISYFAHIRIFILSEELAREGISKTLDYLSRDHEFRTDFYIAIARGTTAKQLLSCLTPLEKIPANKMYNSLDIAEKEWSPVATIQLDELIRSVISKGKDPVLTGLRIVGDQERGNTNANVEASNPPANIQVWGLAVFKKDKMIGWLNETESKGFTDLTDKLHRTIIEAACPQGERLAVDVIRSNSTVKGSVNNGKPKVEITIRSEADISDVECRINLSRNETIAYLQKEIAATIKHNSEAAVKKAKFLQSDIFGFGEAIRRANPSYWKTIQNDWEDHFQNLQVDIKADVKIRRTGTTGDSYLNKLTE